MYRENIKATILKYANLPNFPIKEFRAKAKRYPDGELSFWRKKRYEYIEELKEKSILGHVWVNEDCPDLATMPDFIGTINATVIDYIDEFSDSHLTPDDKNKIAQRGIDIFFRLWLEYRAIDAIIKDLEQQEKGIGNITYEGLYKKSDDCTRITKIILDQACENGIFIGFKDIKGTAKNQLLIAYDIIKDRFLDPDVADTQGRVTESRRIFIEHFGWYGYRDNKPEDARRYIPLSKPTANYNSKHNREAKTDLKLLLK